MTPARHDTKRQSHRRRDVPGSIAYRPSEHGSWLADVTVNGKRQTLGRYNTKAAAEAALRAYAADNAAEHDPG